MSTKPSSDQPPQLPVVTALEMLRSHAVELEAVAHAAENALQYLPYVPREHSVPGQEDTPYTDKQLGVGRLQAMVAATSSASRNLLRTLDRLLERVYEPNEHPQGADAPSSNPERLAASSPPSTSAISIA